MVELEGIEPSTTLPGIPAAAQPHQPSIFVAHQCPKNVPDYRKELAEALRAVNAAGQALVALAQALAQSQESSPGGSQGVQVEPMDPSGDLLATFINGHQEIR